MKFHTNQFDPKRLRLNISITHERGHAAAARAMAGWVCGLMGRGTN